MSFRLMFNFIIIMILFLILFSFGMFQGGFLSWFLFFSFLPIFLYHIGLLIYPMKRWKITREINPSYVEAGSEVKVTVKIHRKIAFPLYYCVFEEVLPESLNREDQRLEKYKYMSQPLSMRVQRNEKQIIFPGFRRTININYHIARLPRGEHELNNIRIRTGDVFGLIKKEHVFNIADYLLVHPSRRMIHMSEQSQSFEQGAISTHSLKLSNTNVAAGIREYLPGDRFSWIDWKQSARRNTMMTKEFEQEKSTDTLIVLDCMAHDRLNELAFEATVEIGHSFIEMFKRNSTSAGFLTIGRKSVFFPVQPHTNHNDMVERHLTTIQPNGLKLFSHTLKEELMRLQSQYLIIILTTHIDERLKEMIKELEMQRKRVVLIFVQAEKSLTQTDLAILHHLAQKNVFVSHISEAQLIEERIEVNRL